MKENNKNKETYDPGRSGSSAALRAIAGAYLVYLGYGIIRDCISAADQPLYMWLFGILFIAAGAAFVVFAWKTYRRETRLPESDEQDDPVSDEQADAAGSDEQNDEADNETPEEDQQ